METSGYLYHPFLNPGWNEMKEDTLCIRKEQVMKIMFYFEP